MIRTLLFTVLVTACASSPSSGIAASEITCPPDSTLTYENFGSTLIADNCLACHAAKQRPTLATQAAVQANKAAIINVAVTGTKMPSNGSMSIDERQMLGEWLACGAP
ncbi:MAG TPA: cytochrome c [Kofleriaceae bacterium]|nr:cytochrome c [Kofleriaceae bacterium]